MTRRCSRPLPPLGVLILSALSISFGLPPATMTARAAAAAPKVYRDRVEPHWFADNTRFWYRNDLPGDGREFVVVSATNGVRQPAFDHARVAVELGRLLGRNLEATRLPISSLEFATNANRLSLRGDEGVWELDPESHSVRASGTNNAADPGLPVLPEPRPSARTGPETAITFENRLTEDVAIFWMSDSGERQPYGTLKPGQNRRQHTFAGHVWIAVRGVDVVAVFEAADVPRRALIDGRPADAQRGGRRNRTRGATEERPAPPATVRSPDGRLEAFVRDHNLWVRILTNSTETQLSFDGSAGLSFHRDSQRARLIGMEYDTPEFPATLPEVSWSPDSRKLLALQTRTVPERRVQLIESSPKDQLQPKLSSYPYLKAGDEIPTQTPRLFDATGSREIPFSHDLLAKPWSVDEFRWAPDSSRVTFLFNGRGHQVMRVLAVTPPSDSSAPGTPAPVTPLVNEECATFFDYSNKTFLHFLDSAKELIWMSERDGWNHLYLVDAVTGRVKNAITHGEWVVRGVDKVDDERRQIWFRVSGIHPGQDPYHIHLARVNLDGTGLTVLTDGDGTHEIQWSPDRLRFLDTWSRVDLPPVTELRNAADGARLCQLEQADASEVVQARGRLPERFVAKGRDGTTEIWGLLHRPRDFDPKRHYAVIENIYAGPHGQHVPKSFRAAYRHQEEIADRGFVVVQVDGMGTNWRSRQFHDVAWRNLVDAGFPDRIAWLRAAAAKFPELDLGRVGIYGGSAGGQNALGALLTHGDFYRAGVSDCGCHDNRMDKIWWSEAWMGWPVGPHYAEQSNASLASRLTGKLMLFVGELDRNVDPASTTQVVNALIRAGKEFDFVLVPGSGHGSAESDYGRRRRADFFARHLGPPTP